SRRLARNFRRGVPGPWFRSPQLLPGRPRAVVPVAGLPAFAAPAAVPQPCSRQSLAVPPE
ncbi:hypothetical protein, partial [uncultured Alistipes sp.]|uniref:hypothetical protein n=1 Tax=uncultured Alistipes sp. TaxID=538949 RepID=UPI0025EA79A2